MSFFFSRDTKVYMKWAYEAGVSADTALYEIPVLDGFSFSQATNTSEITLNEAENTDGVSKRGRAMFNDSFAPAEWSFTTYVRPTESGGSDSAGTSGAHAGNSKNYAIEGPLWAAMSAVDYDKACGLSSGTNGAGDDGTAFEPNSFNWANSNKSALGVFDLFFVLGASKTSGTTYTTGTDGAMIYKISDCSVGSASIDFDIEGIAQVAWSGQGKKISEVASLNTAVNGETALAAITSGISSTSNFVRQKISQLGVIYDASETTGSPSGNNMGSDTTYSLTLTGGNITIENNLTYLTPETLGVVNQPLGHVMGTRNISGNFTCYLNDASNGSAELFEDLHEATTAITNRFDLLFYIGGTTGSTPRMEVRIPRAHLEMPTHSIDDVIGVEVNFHGLPSDLGATDTNGCDEVSVKYLANSDSSTSHALA